MFNKKKLNISNLVALKEKDSIICTENIKKKIIGLKKY